MIKTAYFKNHGLKSYFTNSESKAQRGAGPALRGEGEEESAGLQLPRRPGRLSPVSTQARNTYVASDKRQGSCSNTPRGRPEGDTDGSSSTLIRP